MEKKDNLFSTAIVEKRNVLNEFRKNNMTLQELRFFCIYLSKINPYDVSTRIVRFPLADFQQIMEFGRLNIAQLKECTDRLLQHIIHVPNEDGKGYDSFQIFKRCKLIADEYDEWYIEIDAHDQALPLMFDYKDKYFTYELWNILRLKSSNQLRMYEILKQYEKIGRRELSIDELRHLLGIASDEYDRFERFRVRVLDSCQQALAENTDIIYTYEKGRSRGRKWYTIIFHIKKNPNFVDKLSVKTFIDKRPDIATGTDNENNIIPNKNWQECVEFLCGSCCEEFTYEQMDEIVSIIVTMNPHPVSYGDIWVTRYHYLNEFYHRLLTESSIRTIKNRFKYFRQMIINDKAEKEKKKSGY